jgi:hypothetical protein
MRALTVAAGTANSARNSARLITRRVPVEQWTTALDHEPDDIKIVVDFS